MKQNKEDLNMVFWSLVIMILVALDAFRMYYHIASIEGLVLHLTGG